MKNRSDIYNDNNKLILQVQDFESDAYIIFTFEENKDSYAVITDGVEIIWLLKKVESTKDNYIKYMLTSEKEFNIFVKEIREYIIDNQILAIDNKTSLAQILDEQINEMHEEDWKNEN